MPEEYKDRNQMPEDLEVSATLFQDGQFVANGTAKRQGKRLTFYPTTPQIQPPLPLHKVKLKLLDTNSELPLRSAPDYADHKQCDRHWNFEIEPE